MTPKPLDGLRVLVPRGGKWGDGVAATLRTLGATPVVAPMINFASADNAAELANVFHQLEDGQYDWLVVSSATTVDVLMGHRVRIPESTRVVAVGETTAPALLLAGFRVEFVPEVDNSARGLLREWPSISGRVLIPQAEVVEPHLERAIEEYRLDATVVTAYRTVGVPVSEEVREDVASGRMAAILVSSGSVARQIAEQLAPLPSSTIVACIGPRTAFDARAAGLRVDIIAEDRSADSLVGALAEFVSAGRRSPDAG